MDLSIIIINWNTKDLLLQCLKSLFQTTKRIEMEVFVVDNGSIDGSVAAAKEGFSEVKFIQNDINLGFARANNQALRLAVGKYLLLLNPDTMVKGAVLEKLISFMESCPASGVAGAQLLNSDGSKQNSIANFPSLATELINKSFLRWLFPKTFPGKGRNYTEPIEVDSVIGACMMIRREAIEQVGLLDEDYFLFLEETDWCYRMKGMGWKIYHVPQAEVYHFQGKGVEIERKRARIEYFHSRYHFFKKNRGISHWAALLAGLMIRLSVELVFSFIVSLLSLFTVQKWRKRLSLYTYLMWWHLKGCPKGMGLNLLSAQRSAHSIN
jgi:GT2 family glycosyltransferase